MLVVQIMGECRLTDINNIIGGPSYNVDTIVVQSITLEGQNVLFVAGQYTLIETTEKSGYFYALDY
jgi:hypothetical protein